MKVVSDFYYCFKEDIVLMKELGLKIYCFFFLWVWIILIGDGEIN